MSDQGFREIHLDAKQLVFLFMTAAVVLVVAFLCGVLVGRGVPRQETVVAAESVPADTVEEQAPAPIVSAQPSSAPLSPPPADEDLSYLARLEGRPVPGDSVAAGKPAPQTAQARTPAVEPPTAREAASPPPAQRAGGTTPTKAPGSAALNEPAGQGYAVQVTALRDRSNAEGVARRLVAKGHHAYVLAPGPRGSRMFRVVVGKFKTRQEAEQASRRLEREEQFKPWITR